MFSRIEQIGGKVMGGLLRIAGGVDTEFETHRAAIVRILGEVLSAVESGEVLATSLVVCLRDDDSVLVVRRYARPDEAIGILERSKMAIAMDGDG